MTDLVVGLGEIGMPIKRYLEEMNFNVDGYDPKIPQYSLQKGGNYEIVHICIPYSKDFNKIVLKYKKQGLVIIHSTVKPGTSKELGVIYSPVRGQHNRMVEALKEYQKYYSGMPNPEIEKRWPNSLCVPESEKLELTKIIVDTTYLGFLVTFRKIVDKKYPGVYWHFASQINDKLKNRPIMYNDNQPIGGHCVMPNLELIDESIITDLIRGKLNV